MIAFSILFILGFLHILVSIFYEEKYYIAALNMAIGILLLLIACGVIK